MQSITPGKALTISASSGRPVSPVPNAEGGRVVHPAVAGHNAVDKSNAGSSISQMSGTGLASPSSNNTTNEGKRNGSGVKDHLPTATLLSPGLGSTSSPLSLTADTIKPPTASPTGSEKKLCSVPTEIAAIKRRCATNLLALVPLNVARTFFGAPASPPNDRTCSTSTKSSPSLTTSSSPSSPSPPTWTDEGGGDLSTRSLSQGPSKTSPVAPGKTSASTLSGPGSRSGNVTAAKDEPRTDDRGDEAEVPADELYLLEMIEADLLDLLEDDYCNKHLIYAILETVLAKVLPELTERSVSELMEDRGVSFVPPAF